jgi:hypothetical protein
MFSVVTAVAVHGNLVPVAVAVQVPMPGPVAVHSPPNVPVVISKFAVLETFAVNDDLVQLEVILPTAPLRLVNPMLGESSVW